MLPDFLTNPPPIARLLAEGGPDRLADDLRAGLTLRDIADRIGCTRGVLTRWIASLPPDVQVGIRTADQEGATAMVEEAKTIADDTAEDIRGMTKPLFNDKQFVCDVVDPQAILAAEKERIRVRQWMAERKDKDAWGVRPTTEVNMNFNSVFLDVLRKRNTRQTEPIAVIDSSDDVSAFL